MGITFPGESAGYRAARDRLLDREIELRRAMEAVAEARRALPPGGPVPEDYAFGGRGEGGVPTEVRLSALFRPGGRSLVIYSFMFPRHPGVDEGPCPSCTAQLDQLEGAADHIAQNLDLVIVAKAPLPLLLAVAQERGWSHLRLLSSGGNTYNRDYGAEEADGRQQPMLNVFHREPDGTLRHFWGSELLYAPTDPGQDARHVGTLEPLWNLFDFTPEGRPDWDEQLSYPS